MIEKMKVVHIVAAQTQKTELLDALRALGIVHFADKVDADQGYLERFAALSRLITVLEEQGMSEVEAETLDDDQFKVLFDGLNACLERKKALEAERAAAVSAAQGFSAKVRSTSRPARSAAAKPPTSCATAAAHSRQVDRPSAPLSWQTRAAFGFSAPISASVWPSVSPQAAAICPSSA